jgi:WD40 repeat protein
LARIYKLILRLVSLSLMAAVFIPSVSQKAYAVEIRRLNETSGMNVFDEESVINIAVNPQNPSLIAVSSGQGEIALLDKATMTMQWRYFAGTEKIAFSHTGQQLGVVGHCFFTLTNTLDGVPILSIDLDFEMDQPSARRPECNINHFYPTNILFSESDQIVYVAQNDRIVKIDLSLGRIIAVYGGRFSRFFSIEDIRLSDNEDFLYVVDKFNFYSIYTLNGTITKTQSHSSIYGLPVGNLGKKVISRDGLYTVYAPDVYIYIVDNIQKNIVRRQLVAAERITALDFSYDLTSVMLSSSDGTSRIYNIATGVEDFRLDDTRPSNRRSWQMTLATGNGFDDIYTGDGDGNVWIWEKTVR